MDVSVAIVPEGAVTDGDAVSVVGVTSLEVEATAVVAVVGSKEAVTVLAMDADLGIRPAQAVSIGSPELGPGARVDGGCKTKRKRETHPEDAPLGVTLDARVLEPEWVCELECVDSEWEEDPEWEEDVVGWVVPVEVEAELLLVDVVDSCEDDDEVAAARHHRTLAP